MATRKPKEKPVTPKTYCKCEYRVTTHASDFAGDKRRVILRKDTSDCPIHNQDETHNL